MHDKDTNYGVNLDTKVSEVNIKILKTFMQEMNDNNKIYTDKITERIKQIEHKTYQIKKKMIRISIIGVSMLFIIDMLFMSVNIYDSINNYSLANHVLSIFYPALFLVTVLIMTRGDKTLRKEIKEYELKNEKK